MLRCVMTWAGLFRIFVVRILQTATTCPCLPVLALSSAWHYVLPVYLPVCLASIPLWLLILQRMFRCLA